ncbi:unnamed protein product [Ectocarpus sp. CCAP 1310/34]|nr:unnamed protein product [Ectocarpus sp. CCAP 1310/34]
MKTIGRMEPSGCSCSRFPQTHRDYFITVTMKRSRAV